jgi:glycosyl-4,4'-diaponeurosporenoate acyltransferase
MRLKKILFTAFSLFLVYISYDLLLQIWRHAPSNDSHSKLLLVAFLINLFETGIFAFPGFVYPTSRLLGSSYYEVRHPRRLKCVCRFLGVGYFKKALMFFYWGRPKQRQEYFDGTRSGIENLIYQANQSEFGHLAALILISLSGLALLTKGHLLLFAYITAINLVGNGYPILIQRHHRLRVARLRGHINR